MIEVVSAVIIQGGRLFLAQRPEGKDFAFLWESPGGKVDGAETHELALRRELHEELDVRLEWMDEKPIWNGEFRTENLARPDRGHIHLFMYVVDIWERTPIKPLEGQGTGWFVEEEVRHLRLAPGNMRACGAILQAMRKKGPDAAR